MSNREPIEILVALHFNRADRPLLVSIDGVNANAKWIGRKLIGSLHETGQKTSGTDRFGNKVMLPLANLTVPEWLAKNEGFI